MYYIDFAGLSPLTGLPFFRELLAQVAPNLLCQQRRGRFQGEGGEEGGGRGRGGSGVRHHTGQQSLQPSLQVDSLTFTLYNHPKNLSLILR